MLKERIKLQLCSLRAFAIIVSWAWIWDFLWDEEDDD